MGKYHSAAECTNKRSSCNQSHGTLICNQKTKSVPTLASSEEHGVIYPVVVVLINDINYIALLKTLVPQVFTFLRPSQTYLKSHHSGGKPNG